MRVKLDASVIAPNDATHYTGELSAEAFIFWHKTVMCGGDVYWCTWSGQVQKWIIDGLTAPNGVEPIPPERIL